jgi:hypothetical protein
LGRENWIAYLIISFGDYSQAEVLQQVSGVPQTIDTTTADALRRLTCMMHHAVDVPSL